MYHVRTLRCYLSVFGNGNGTKGTGKRERKIIKLRILTWAYSRSLMPNGQMEIHDKQYRYNAKQCFSSSLFTLVKTIKHRQQRRDQGEVRNHFSLTERNNSTHAQIGKILKLSCPLYYLWNFLSRTLFPKDITLKVPLKKWYP